MEAIELQNEEGCSLFLLRNTVLGAESTTSPDMNE
jgi:sulfur relay (sulfurtransferase) complex TusBCD TusD component (DsrE family)